MNRCSCRSVAVEVGFEPTEGLPPHTLSSTAHHRSPASASVLTSTDRRPADAGERPRTGVNETKTEPGAAACRPVLTERRAIRRALTLLAALAVEGYDRHGVLVGNVGSA